MFDSKEENDKAVSGLIAATQPLQRGDVLPWVDAERVVGIGRDQCRFWSVVNRFRKKLRQTRGIACRPVNGVGLKFLGESEQVRRCSEDRHRKMFRQSTRAIREIEAVSGTNLSIVDRKLRMFSLDKLREERRSIRQAVKQVVAIRKSETIPQRPVEASK